MRPQPNPPNVHTIPAAFEMFPEEDPFEVSRGVVVSPLGSMHVWTWLERSRFTTACANIGYATLLPLADAAKSHLLISFSHEDDVRLTQVLPDSLSPVAGVVRDTAALIDSLTIRPLRDFLLRALLRPEALRWYWRCPASRRDHHAYPGGLAKHSLDRRKRPRGTRRRGPRARARHRLRTSARLREAVVLPSATRPPHRGLCARGTGARSAHSESRPAARGRSDACGDHARASRRTTNAQTDPLPARHPQGRTGTGPAQL